MRWKCMSRALRFLQITAEHRDRPLFTVFVTINISITLLQIPLKLHEHREAAIGGKSSHERLWKNSSECREILLQVKCKIGGGFISLLWQLRCHCNPDHKKFSFLSNTTVVTIFPNLCIWRRSLCSTLGGIDPEELASSHLNTEELKFYVLDSNGLLCKMIDGGWFQFLFNY